jgi:nitrous oxidase accessory protein NosD
MRKATFLGALIALVFLFLAKSASAQATRTWVSGVGDDVNPCSRTAPCKTFAGAIMKTAARGVINALDPGGFGNVVINKAITIDARGTMGGVLNAGTNGIVVAAGATDTVILRGLTIQGAGTGLAGVKFTSGKSLQIEDCSIFGQSGAAIDFQPAVAATLFLKHVTATANGGGGLLVGGTATATVTNSHFFDDVIGLHALGSARVTVHDSIFSGNTGKGIHAEGTAEVNMDHGLIAGNAIGVQGDAPVRLSEVMIGHNTVGLAGPKVSSFGNNRVASGNGTDGAPSGTLPQQ